MLLAILALAGCGGDDESASEFAVRVIGLLEAGNAGAAWDELHPAHRSAIPRPLYVRCEGSDGLGGDVGSLEVAGVREERSTVPGQGEAAGTEVALSFALDGEPVELDMHVFEIDGEWGWVVGENDYAVYATGDCPG
jgi:hypothetical protein